jgi:hypothetical protein
MFSNYPKSRSDFASLGLADRQSYLQFLIVKSGLMKSATSALMRYKPKLSDANFNGLFQPDE